MTLAAGLKLGPYEILSPIGAGGIGEASASAIASSLTLLKYDDPRDDPRFADLLRKAGLGP